MILNKMFYTSLWILAIFFKGCYTDRDAVEHPRIFPPFPFIESGSTLQVFCSIGKVLFPYKNASHIIWTLNDTVIAEENYLIINESVSGVIIHNITYGRAHIKCFANSPVEKQLLAQSEVKSGFPPQKPGNISCVFYYKSTLTCSWASGREAHTETSYVLIKKDEFETCPEVNCSNKTFSCSRTQEPFSDLDYCVQVKAKNNFGKVESECIPQSSPKIFKPNAPQISKIEPVPGKKQSLKVFWQKLESLRTDPTKFQIRYRAGKENSTKNVTFFGNTESTSYVLTDLWNFTNYTVAFRWTIEQSSEWSEWSTDKMGTTEEQAPLRVDLWRVIKSHQSFGNRTVRLLWKKCQEFPSSGIVNGYRVKYFKEGNVSFERSVDLNKAITGYTLNLSEEAYEVSVIAHNTVGDSPEAILRIPSMYEESNGHQIILNLNASVSSDKISLEWKTLDLEIDGYIIEWYNELETNPFKRTWQKVTNITKWISPQGTFLRLTPYNISVYPVVRGKIKAPRTITTYFHEGSPSVGPVASVYNIDKHEAIVAWKEVAKAKRNGIIFSYTILYRDDSGKKLEKTVDASVLQYQLKNLQAGTKYTVNVMANTTRGGTRGSSTTFNTKLLSVVDIILINAITGTVILCLLAVGILWTLKKHTLKRICWPKIPHPVILDCPDSSQEITLRKSPCEDETLISILQVDAHSKDYKKLHLQHLENPFGQTNGIAKEIVHCCGISHSGAQDTVKPLPQISSLEYHFKSQVFPIMEQASKVFENKEAHVQLDLNNTEFSPYLKNSVHTRLFLASDSSDKNSKRTEEPLVPLSGQPYVALDTFELFSKRS